MLTIEQNLDMSAESAPMPVIPVGQYDTGVTIIFTLFASVGADFTIPDGTTAIVRGTKGDRTGVLKSVELDGTTVTLTVDDQMTAVAGLGRYEVVLTNGGEVLSSSDFILNVVRAAMDAETEITTVDLPEFTQIVEKMSELLAAVDTILEVQADVDATAEDVEAAKAAVEEKLEEFQAYVSEASEDIGGDREAVEELAQQVADSVAAALESITASKEAAVAEVEAAKEDIELDFTALSNSEIEALMG